MLHVHMQLNYASRCKYFLELENSDSGTDLVLLVLTLAVPLNQQKEVLFSAAS